MSFLLSASDDDNGVDDVHREQVQIHNINALRCLCLCSISCLLSICLCL